MISLLFPAGFLALLLLVRWVITAYFESRLAVGRAISEQFDAHTRYRREHIDPLLETDSEMAAHAIQLWFSTGQRIIQRSERWHRSFWLRR